MRDDTLFRCTDCGETDYSRSAHICPATCPNGDRECPGPGATVVTAAMCHDCRTARRRVVRPLERR
jgi:5-methylcytosine-specific restriction endonuclease McrA